MCGHRQVLEMPPLRQEMMYALLELFGVIGTTIFVCCFLYWVYKRRLKRDIETWIRSHHR